MIRIRILAGVVFVAVLLAPCARADHKYLIIGDSLSKEYSVEGPGLWSAYVNQYPQVLDARNWMEILIDQRGPGVEFNFGSWGTWPDTRATGHELNWAIPATMTSDWVNLMNSPTYILWRYYFDPSLGSNANRVVILLGGNDLSNNYGPYYNGADYTTFVAGLLSNFTTIVNYVIAKNPAAQIVICTAPDVGATPSKQAAYPIAAQRARVTALTESLNAGIAQLAAQKGLGLADVYAFTKEYIAPGTVTIGGVPMIKGVDSANNPRYLFSADSFHPNTASQALIANEIIRAFNARFQAGIALLTGSQIIAYLEKQHQTTIDIHYADWVAAYGVGSIGKLDDPDGDGIPNGVEYALGLDPSKPDAGVLPAAQMTMISGTSYLSFTYVPRAKYTDHTVVTPQVSTRLSGWLPVDPSALTDNGDGSFTVRLPASGSSLFLRLGITVSD